MVRLIHHDCSGVGEHVLVRLRHPVYRDARELHIVRLNRHSSSNVRELRLVRLCRRGYRGVRALYLVHLGRRGRDGEWEPRLVPLNHCAYCDTRELCLVYMRRRGLRSAEKLEYNVVTKSQMEAHDNVPEESLRALGRGSNLKETKQGISQCAQTDGSFSSYALVSEASGPVRTSSVVVF